MVLEDLKQILQKKGAGLFYYKYLSENDNCKNQIYLGSSYDILQFIPYGEITPEVGVKRPTMKAPVKWSWISDDGKICPAPNTKMILYPKYPEIRLSGFLSGCPNSPGKHMQPIPKEERTGEDGRVLVFCPIEDEVFAYLAPAGSEIANRLKGIQKEELFGKEIIREEDSKTEILTVLAEAYRSNPNKLVKLNALGQIVPYNKRNAAGYTLEARFGIKPNGKPDPDYKGWELKCYTESAITLLTPQPNGGIYADIGNKEFVMKYGHLVAETGATYFTGPYSCSLSSEKENRRLIITGYDTKKNLITESTGSIALIQDDKEELASWSFAHILSHWTNKHNKACYVRYKKIGEWEINYLPIVQLCEGTNPMLLINAIRDNLIFYDPGCKVSADGESKARSQFRIKAENLNSIYTQTEVHDLSKM